MTSRNFAFTVSLCIESETSVLGTVCIGIGTIFMFLMIVLRRIRKRSNRTYKRQNIYVALKMPVGSRTSSQHNSCSSCTFSERI